VSDYEPPCEVDRAKARAFAQDETIDSEPWDVRNLARAFRLEVDALRRSEAECERLCARVAELETALAVTTRERDVNFERAFQADRDNEKIVADIHDLANRCDSLNALASERQAERSVAQTRVAELEAALADLWDADAFGPHPLLKQGGQR